MLIDFRVENHRSIRNEQAFTMEASNVGDKDDPRPRACKGHKKKLLPVAAFYGANASGKSNFLDALWFMRDSVMLSFREWPPDGGVPRHPFAWGSGSNEPSLYEVTFIFSGVRYQYGFVTTNEAFVEEWLYAWPRGRKQVWFVRDEEKFKFSDKFSGDRAITKLTRPNALFLSSAAQFNHGQLGTVFSWFRVLAGGTRSGPSNSEYLIQNMLTQKDSSKKRDNLLLFLQAADVGITGILLDGPPVSPFLRAQGLRPKILFKHKSTKGDALLRLEDESKGTRTLLKMAPDLLHVLATGQVLIVDELEAGLHPLLAAQIIRQFNNPETNPKNAQLIFTTHDTNLLGNTLSDSILRRDQIWFTEKNGEGETTLFPLSDFGARKHANLERGYLQGRFGAIPFLGDFTAASE